MLDQKFLMIWHWKKDFVHMQLLDRRPKSLQQLGACWFQSLWWCGTKKLYWSRWYPVSQNSSVTLGARYNSFVMLNASLIRATMQWQFQYCDFSVRISFSSSAIALNSPLLDQGQGWIDFTDLYSNRLTLRIFKDNVRCVSTCTCDHVDHVPSLVRLRQMKTWSNRSSTSALTAADWSLMKQSLL